MMLQHPVQDWLLEECQRIEAEGCCFLCKSLFGCLNPFFFHHYNFLDYQETERTLTCILQQTSWYSSAEYWQILQTLKPGENKHPSSPERGVGMCLLQKLPSHQGGRWGVVRVLSLSESRYYPTSAWKRFCSRVLMSTALCQSPWAPLFFCLGADGWNAGCPGIRWFPSHFSVPGKAASANEGLMFLICFAVQKSFYWDCNSEDNICLLLQETIWVSELMPRDWVLYLLLRRKLSFFLSFFLFQGKKVFSVSLVPHRMMRE